MKKQLALAMVMVLCLVSITSVPTQASGGCSVNGNSQSKNCVVGKAQIKDLPEVKSALEDLRIQLQNGNGKNCQTIILPDCSQSKVPDCNQSGNCSQSKVPDCNQSGNCSQSKVPDCNQSGNCSQSKVPDSSQTGNCSGLNVSGSNWPVTIIVSGQGNCNSNVTDKEKPDNSQTGGSQPDNNQSGSNQSGKPDTNKPDNSQSGNDVSSSETNNTETDTKEPEKDNEALTFEEQVVKLVNEERAKAGLHALKIDTEVASAAAIRTKEIETSFSHTRPDGRKFSSVLTDNGIRYTGAGENIAWGQTSPEKVMEAWMNSEGHRANILNSKFTKIGVGHYQNAFGRNYWAQLFTY